MKKLFFTVSLISLISCNLLAALTPGAISTATGGSGRGTTEPVDSVLLNPAIVAALPTKFFSANYTNEQWGVTISDNGKDALFPAAVAFVKSDANNLKTQQISVALSYAFQKSFAVGLGVSMLEYDLGGAAFQQKYRQSIGDVGFVYAPSPVFGVGLVANKVFSSATEIAQSLQKQKTIGFGAQYTYLSFARFRFDIESAPENKTDRLVYMGGIETFINDWVIIRLGYQNNNVLAKNFSSLGLGFAGPQFGLHYAYISNVVDKSEDKHSIDLGIPF